MSRTFNMVGSGGEKAVLAVTVTNGTPTSVTATKTGGSVSLAHDSTNDIWTGNVTPGTWTVTATDGTNSGSVSVTVDTVRVYSLIVGMSELGGDYTKLQYIESSGTQLINTGIAPKDYSYFRIEFKMRPIILGGYFYGAGSNSSANAWCSYEYNTGNSRAYWNVCNKTLQAKHTISANTDYTHTTTYANGTFSTTGSYTTSFSYSGTLGIGNLVFFGSSINSSGGYSYTRLYYLKLYTGSGYTKVRDFVPARRNSDSAVGMVDTVNNVFYASATSNAFVAGPAA